MKFFIFSFFLMFSAFAQQAPKYEGVQRDGKHPCELLIEREGIYISFYIDLGFNSEFTFFESEYSNSHLKSVGKELIVSVGTQSDFELNLMNGKPYYFEVRLPREGLYKRVQCFLKTNE